MGNRCDCTKSEDKTKYVYNTTVQYKYSTDEKDDAPSKTVQAVEEPSVKNVVEPKLHVEPVSEPVSATTPTTSSTESPTHTDKSVPIVETKNEDSQEQQELDEGETLDEDEGDDGEMMPMPRYKYSEDKKDDAPSKTVQAVEEPSVKTVVEPKLHVEPVSEPVSEPKPTTSSTESPTHTNESVPIVEIKIEYSQEQQELDEGKTLDEDEGDDGELMPMLRYKYSEDQWSPLNLEGKKRYDREFLLQFQNDVNAIQKPAGLPVIPGIILDKPQCVGRQFRREEQPGNERRPDFMDFTPRYMWGVGQGGGGGSRSRGMPRQPSCRVAADKVSTYNQAIGICQSVQEEIFLAARRSSGLKILSNEDMERKTKGILYDYFAGQNLEEAVVRVKELSKQKHHHFVLFAIHIVMERSSIARTQTGQLLHHLIKQNVISVDSYIEGLGDVLTFAEDLETENPKIWQHYGELISPMIQDGTVPLMFIKLAANPLIARNKAVDVLDEITGGAKKEDLYRKTRSILNKLTPQKFQTLVSQMQALPIDTEVKLKGVVDLIFEKVINESRYRVAYANMCRCLSMFKVPSESKSGEMVKFRAVLLTRCQREFEKDKSSEALFVNKREEIDEAEEGAKKEELKQELEYEESKAKRRSLGNILFIGELFKLKMLTENIMHDCVFKLLRFKDPENLECLCGLLTNIGKELDVDKAKPRMDQYFNRMSKIVNDKKTVSRVRFMLQDVIDLRTNKWMPRRVDNSSETVYQTYQQKLQEKALILHQSQMVARSQRRGGGGGGRRGPPGLMGGSHDGWNTVASNRTPLKSVDRSIDPSKMKLSKKNVDESAIQLGPGGGGSRFAGWGRGTGGTTDRPSQEKEKPNTPANRFSSLSRPEEESGRRYYGGVSPARGDSRGRGSGGFGRPPNLSAILSIESERERAVAAANTRTELERQSSPAKPFLSELKLLSADEMEKKTKAILDEYFAVQDTKEAILCVQELSAQNHHQFVLYAINHVLERSSTARKQTGHVLHDLVKQKVISVDNYIKGLVEVLEFAEDLEIDITKIWQYYGEMISPMIQDDSVPLSFLKQAAQPLIANNKAGVLLAEIIHDASHREYTIAKQAPNMSVLTGNNALVMIYSQTCPIYPYGSARDPSKAKTTIIENPYIGRKCDVDAVYLKAFFSKLYQGRADIAVKMELSFAETCEDIRKRIQSGKKYDNYFIIFLTFVDDKGRLQFYEPNFEQGLQYVDVFVNLVMDLQKEIDGKSVIFLIQADDLTLLGEKVYKKATVYTGNKDRILETEPSNQEFLLIRSTIPQKITDKESLLVRAFVDAMEKNVAKPDREQKDMTTLLDDIKHQVMVMVRTETRSLRASDLPEPIVLSSLTKPLYVN